MPDPALLTPLGQQMRDALPPVLRNSIDYLAVIHACAREVELLEDAIERARAEFDPASADLLLPAWEAQLRLPVGGGPMGATTAERRARVLARLRKTVSGGSGREWEQAITEIIGPDWVYQEHDPSDATSPPDGTIRITVPYPSGDPHFTEMQNQAAAIIDAHLTLEFASSVMFELDSSELDAGEFGA